MEEFTVYRCPYDCPINKSCIILKSEEPLTAPLNAVYKCKAVKKDIRVTIGEPVRPP